MYHGDSLEILKTIDSDSIDSLVTDPPAGISFMGKSWDGDKGGRDQWIQWMSGVLSECHRVLKPGAYGLIWALPRTSHWTATSAEDAGFEIRDVITHLFGSGFPKSHDISKAIDRAEKTERVCTKQGESKPTPGVFDPRCSSTRPRFDLPATDAAKQWQGFGTALKPASEHWVLVRKPISEKTVAANVLKHGVGGLNIDGCRVEASKDYGRSAANSRGTINAHNGFEGKSFKIAERDGDYASSLGRFPANLVLSCSGTCTEDAHDMFDCPIAMLDEQSGDVKSAGRYLDPTSAKEGGNGIFAGGRITNAYAGEQGGASRFFYCAKASRKDKGENNSHPTPKNTKLMQYLIRLITPLNGIVLDPFMGSGSTGVAAAKEGFGFIGIEREKEYFKIAKTRIEIIDPHRQGEK